MSSHHIVRDEQEPALLIAGFSMNQKEDIGQLLEWSPTVIAMENSINDLITLGVKVDVAVVPEDQKNHWQEVLQFQQPVRFLHANGEQVSVIAGIIQHYLDQNYKTFHLLSNQMTVFTFINLCQYFKYKAELVFINESQKVTVHQVGSYKKWLTAGESISVFPIEDPTYLRTTGFTENLDNQMIREEIQFVTADEGLVTLETNLKPVLLAESL
ncbi:MAG: hypothetical protein AAFO69_03500 [Bacteroidota bacterium]